MAANVQSEFDMAEATFASIPDFTQAHFVEAPRLDNIKVAVGSGHKPQEHDAAHYRTLRRIATQGHDHEQEINFFASEIIARRGYEDKKWRTRWWFGVLYEAFGDFGRSIWRPLIGLGILMMWCANGYIPDSQLR